METEENIAAYLLARAPPAIEEVDGIHVARDDLLPGGTKSRYFYDILRRNPHVVWATPAQGGAQLALAYCARALGARATLFVADRRDPHPRTKEAAALGAEVIGVSPGFKTNVMAKAAAFAEAESALFIPLRFDSYMAREAIAEAAAPLEENYGPFSEVWCAGGSGLLSRGLQMGIPKAQHYLVSVGWKLSTQDLGDAREIRYPRPYSYEEPDRPPFPSCPVYDAKAWWTLRFLHRRNGRVLFWNVLGPSPTDYAPEEVAV